MRAGEVLRDIKQKNERGEMSNADYGRSFENLFCQVARVSPELEIDKIYPIAQWPDAGKYGLDGRDIGVDLVATRKNGDIIAVQCKAHKSVLGKQEIQSFLAGSINEIFKMRWLVSTSAVGPNAIRMLINSNARVIPFDQYYETELQADQSPQDELWTMQRTAVRKVIDGFAEQDRGKLVMACGTGKTFTSLNIAKQLNPNGIVLFIAPSIALVAQARREWLRRAGPEQEILSTVICSDPTVTEKSTYEEILSQLSCEVTTNPEEIAASIEQNLKIAAKETNPTITAIFCTYHSLDKLMEAQRNYDLPDFDLAIIDEAHRTTGIEKSNEKTRMFQRIHKNENIRCRKRLYMTATPRVYSAESKKRYKDGDNYRLSIIDMSDEAIYGPIFHHISFKEAVDDNKLCKVKIIAVGISEEILTNDLLSKLKDISNRIEGFGGAPDEQEYLSAFIIYAAITGQSKSNLATWTEHLSRTIAYASTIRKSKWLSQVIKEFNSGTLKDIFHNSADEIIPKVEAEHLDAGSSASERQKALNNLSNAEADQVLRIISNVRLFSEGVDVPTLSSIAFLNASESEINIIQSIGRVMRKPKDGNKEYGYVIAPFYLEKGEKVEDALASKSPRFEILAKVLRAMMAHDPDIVTDLKNSLSLQIVKPSRLANNPSPDEQLNLELEGFANEVLDGLYPQIANYTGLSNRGDFIADLIIMAVKKVAGIFADEGVDKTLALALGASETLFESMNEQETEDKLKEATNTAALILMNACLIHKRLTASDSWSNKIAQQNNSGGGGAHNLCSS